MKPLTPRNLFSEGIIIVGACAGIGLLVIGRFDADRRQVDRELSAASKLLAERGEIEAGQARWLALRASARSAISRMGELSAPAEDAATLHERLTAIARDCDVRIDRIQPAHSNATPPAPSDDPSIPTPAWPKSILTNSIEADGRYDSVVHFIEKLESLGLGRINEVRITPVTDANAHSVHVTLQAVHVAFDTRPQPAQASAQGVTP